MSKYNHFEVLYVDGYSFEESNKVNFGFIAQCIALLNRGDYTIEYSFDGTNLHGDLNAHDASRGMVFDNRSESVIYFRAVDGYGYVRTESWAKE
jgi:hypothetical protein